MRFTLLEGIETDLCDLTEVAQAKQIAKHIGREVYCWKTIGRSNWLERGLSISDVLGLVVLPEDLPELIELPDDPLTD
jgi:hypothetical protein